MTWRHWNQPALNQSNLQTHDVAAHPRGGVSLISGDRLVSANGTKLGKTFMPPAEIRPMAILGPVLERTAGNGMPCPLQVRFWPGLAERFRNIEGLS